MSKEIIDELKLIGNYFDVNKLDVYEQKHHIRFTSIIKDRINFYINKSDKKQLTLTDVVSAFICDYCKDKGSIAYWHKTGMGIKPCKCRKTN